MWRKYTAGDTIRINDVKPGFLFALLWIFISSTPGRFRRWRHSCAAISYLVLVAGVMVTMREFGVLRVEHGGDEVQQALEWSHAYWTGAVSFAL